MSPTKTAYLGASSFFSTVYLMCTVLKTLVAFENISWMSNPKFNIEFNLHVHCRLCMHFNPVLIVIMSGMVNIHFCIHVSFASKLSSIPFIMSQHAWLYISKDIHFETEDLHSSSISIFEHDLSSLDVSLLPIMSSAGLFCRFIILLATMRIFTAWIITRIAMINLLTVHTSKTFIILFLNRCLVDPHLAPFDSLVAFMYFSLSENDFAGCFRVHCDENQQRVQWMSSLWFCIETT